MDHDEAFNAAADRVAAQMNEPAAKEWIAMRKKAGQHLDPETADVMCDWVQIADPYRVCAQFPEELDCIGKEFFARSAGSDIWTAFGDLPEPILERLRERMAAGDFDERPVGYQGKDPASLTAREASRVIQRSFSRDLDTTYFKIDECTRLADGRFQLVVGDGRSAPLGTST